LQNDLDDELDSYRRKSGPASESHESAPDQASHVDNDNDESGHADGDGFGASPPPPPSKPYVKSVIESGFVYLFMNWQT
jgi:hypothetical protein